MQPNHVYNPSSTAASSRVWELQFLQSMTVNKVGSDVAIDWNLLVPSYLTWQSVPSIYLLLQCWLNPSDEKNHDCFPHALQTELMACLAHLVTGTFSIKYTSIDRGKQHSWQCTLLQCPRSWAQTLPRPQLTKHAFALCQLGRLSEAKNFTSNVQQIEKSFILIMQT